ncbi:MAG: cytochrome C [Burkholderiaceae bacterium]
MRSATAMMASILILSACGGSSSDDPSAAATSASLTDPALEQAAAVFAETAFSPTGGLPALPNLVPTINDSGFAATFSKVDVIDRTGPFFQSLGINGRSCSSCHIQGEGWTITPRGVQARFEKTQGDDPIFRLVDGSNSPVADVSTFEARRRAYSMLLSKALIRVGIGIPDGAEFELAAVDDPYGFASAKELSLFRRPLPTANLEFLSAVMWDGRETIADPKSIDCVVGTTNCFATLHFSLGNQSNSATVGHSEAPLPISSAQRDAIVDFQMALFTAQIFDAQTGYLTSQGARGGAVALSSETFYFGINDTLAGDYRSHLPFTSNSMTLYDPWNTVQPDASIGNAELRDRVASARHAVARGQALFNSKSIEIRGVKGLNDALGVPIIAGTCTTCHNAPNIGDHSVPLPLDIGIADAARRTPDMPLYTLRNKATGETLQTTDPGRALISGKWKDIARFKGPILRGLAARAPYFHNGLAGNLSEVVEFYDTRFGMKLSKEEKADLAAFLRTL